MERLGILNPLDELRGIRAGLNISQAKMADCMGLPLRTYEDIEAGRAKVRPVHLKAAYFAVIEFAAEHNGYSDLPPDLAQIVLKAAQDHGTATA